MLLRRVPLVMEAPVSADHDPEILSRVRYIEMVPRSWRTVCWIMQDPVRAGGKKSVKRKNGSRAEG
jgi:hypothetical protein